MIHSCKHDHSNHHANIWTKISAGGGALSDCISSAFWFANIIDVIGGFEESKYMPVSWAALGIGLGLSLLTTAGTTYAHYLLNKSHQSLNHCDHERQSLLKQNKKLSFCQILALVGDYIGHVGTVAAPLAFVVELASKNSLSRVAKGVVYGSATFFGGVVSIAPVQTCSTNMLKSNQYTQFESLV